MDQTLYLLLENGVCFTGKAFGAPLTEDLTAELVFTTAMTGYLETLTDPSYYGQMVVQTFPLTGNYGVIPSDFESKKVHLSAYLAREVCNAPSNFRCGESLDAFLKTQRIPGMYGLDTRRLTRLIREHGVMNGLLTAHEPIPTETLLNDLSRWRVTRAVEQVTCDHVHTYPAGLRRFHVVLWDFGAKQNILRKLRSHGCGVTVVPASATAEEILAHRPDGIMLSNGPGDPKENTGVINELQKLCQSGIPMFGICLGHQLLALANGADTEKLKYGHRGANHPVKDVDTGRIYITSQNHGYTVRTDHLPEGAHCRFVNLNDQTCEGLWYENFPAFSVQFHPEACAGPHDTEFLFDLFIQNMERRKYHAVKSKA